MQENNFEYEENEELNNSFKESENDNISVHSNKSKYSEVSNDFYSYSPLKNFLGRYDESVPLSEQTYVYEYGIRQNTTPKKAFKESLKAVLNRGGIPEIMDHVSRSPRDVGYMAQYIISTLNLQFNDEFTPEYVKEVCDNETDPTLTMKELNESFYKSLGINEKNYDNKLARATADTIDTCLSFTTAYHNEGAYLNLAENKGGNLNGVTPEQGKAAVDYVITNGIVTPSKKDWAQDAVNYYVRLKEIHAKRPWYFRITSFRINRRENAAIEKMETTLMNKLGITKNEVKALQASTVNVCDNINQVYSTYKHGNDAVGEAIIGVENRASARNEAMCKVVGTFDLELGNQLRVKYSADEIRETNAKSTYLKGFNKFIPSPVVHEKKEAPITENATENQPKAKEEVEINTASKERIEIDITKEEPKKENDAYTEVDPLEYSVNNEYNIPDDVEIDTNFREVNIDVMTDNEKERHYDRVKALSDEVIDDQDINDIEPLI